MKSLSQVSGRETIQVPMWPDIGVKPVRLKKNQHTLNFEAHLSETFAMPPSAAKALRLRLVGSYPRARASSCGQNAGCRTRASANAPWGEDETPR